ncbi:hypothetical protein G6F46_011348 [Rhizopus delemar]|uniref:Bromo domain-containing protein n=2 Tax=Rhizopus TaxID=4842 RepID=A0A9P6YTF2_9FUNG|nr:hypothetical protein G6F55_010784 [Rhizopus delemar]KAG1535627.1 hypothetical protein G6F51_011438 [Rhizopus arrhizus]KAG1500414.1 hypothetical protein G6F54_003739 [Rhizopus delemar]KAG1500946.1 hypothetical protein G6F53_011198 [Rhizopus delemar]KAG1511331.1 hypothetical protein G6F52_010677 [Rhizopus delemar]
MSCKEWTVLEKLLLSQAVYKYGEQSWLQVSSVLKQNALIQHRQSDFFDDKNCSLQYYGLIEKLEAEKDNPLPVVVQLARHLYIQRIQEIKNALVDGEQELGQLVSEIDLIRKGELDSQLLQMNAKEIEVCSTSIADKPKETIPLDSKLDNQRQKSWQKSVQILWQEIANHKSGPLFLNPIKKAKAPFYNKIVKKPLDLKIIKNRVREGVIKSTVEFERDIVLMLTNALMYNKEGTETYLLALEMLEDVKDQIELFKFANSFLKRKMV